MPNTAPEKWVEHYGDFLYSFACYRIRDVHIAEDLVQETFLAALKARAAFKGRSSEKTWLTGILKHKIIDHLRKELHKSDGGPGGRFNDADEDLFYPSGKWKIKPAEWKQTPQTLLEQKEFVAMVRHCISKLSDRLSKLFVLREMDGLDTLEICKVFNISTTNFWVSMYRARMSMRRCLEINGFAALKGRAKK